MKLMSDYKSLGRPSSSDIQFGFVVATSTSFTVGVDADVDTDADADADVGPISVLVVGGWN